MAKPSLIIRRSTLRTRGVSGMKSVRAEQPVQDTFSRPTRLPTYSWGGSRLAANHRSAGTSPAVAGFRWSACSRRNILHRSLLTAHCSPLIAHHSLLITHSSLPTSALPHQNNSQPRQKTPIVTSISIVLANPKKHKLLNKPVATSIRDVLTLRISRAGDPP